MDERMNPMRRAAFTFQQIDHIALSVADLKKSVAWYQDVLGLERRYEEVWGECPAMLCAGSTCIALFAAKPDGPVSNVSAEAGASFRHLAFRATYADFLEAERALQQRGMQVEFQDHGIAHSIYFADPDGHRLEITTYDLPTEQKPFLA